MRVYFEFGPRLRFAEYVLERYGRNLRYAIFNSYYKQHKTQTNSSTNSTALSDSFQQIEQ